MPTSTNTNEVLETSNDNDSAEDRFRKAFDRLRYDFPKVLPKGTPVSQNNVAKEAGCIPSALRKSRFPILVMEIQDWVATHKGNCKDSNRQKDRDARNKNRSARQTITDLKLQRDSMAGLLSDANLRIVELTEEIAAVRARLDTLRPSASILNLPK